MKNENHRICVDVLGVALYNGNIRMARNRISEIILSRQSRESRCVSATGAHGLVSAKRNESFAEVLRQFDLNLPDGMPAVWMGRLKGAKTMQRCYGPAFFESLIRKTANSGIRHYLCGGKESVAEELRSVCFTKFNNNNVVGTFCPPFREMTDEELQNLARDIQHTEADIVWIGLSTPKQEFFAARLAKLVEVHFIITVGAAFDFHTDRVRQAPSWIQKTGLEWFFRLCIEPRRLWRRYCEIVPLFIWYNIIEFLGWIMSRIIKRRIGHAS